MRTQGLSNCGNCSLTKQRKLSFGSVAKVGFLWISLSSKVQLLPQHLGSFVVVHHCVGLGTGFEDNFAFSTQVHHSSIV